MNDTIKLTLIWASVIAAVAWALAWTIVSAIQADRDLERHMADRGYVQAGLPGQTGQYWVKP